MVATSTQPAALPQGDLRALVERHTALHRKTSREAYGPCPWCGGTDRFIVRPSENDGAGFWNCRGCQRHGDTIGFLMQREGLDFLAACRLLDPNFAPASAPDGHRRPTGSRTIETAPPSADWQARGQEFVSACVARLWSEQHHATDRALNYLHERGLGDEALHRWQVGYNPKDIYDEPGAWGLVGDDKVWLPRGIVIPNHDEDGALWGIKIRRPVPSGQPNKYHQVRGGKSTLYGAQTLAGHNVAVLTEGELDAILLAQEAGDLAGVVTLGSAEGRLDARGMAALLPTLRILAAYDADPAGRNGAGRLAALSARVRVVRPLLGKDLTDMHQQGGDLRAWVTYHLAKHMPLPTVAEDRAIDGEETPEHVVDVPAQPPMPEVPPREPALPVRFPWRVQWAREMGYLSIRDVQTGEWHEVPVDQCPDAWRNEARAHKAAERLGLAS